MACRQRSAGGGGTSQQDRRACAGSEGAGTHSPEGSRLSAVYRTFNRYDSASAQEAIAGYVQIARQHGLAPAQLALACVIDKPFVASALTGQTTLAQLRENLGALDVTLSDEIKAQIQAVHQRVPNPAP